MQISVIIPTLNEESALATTLTAVLELNQIAEILVVDGGSTDQTLTIAEKHGARVIQTKRGRGRQLDAGARAAKGEIFWFLHADTIPFSNADQLILAALENEKTVGGNFEIVFDGASRAARFLSWLYPKLRVLGLCYGDSAFFVRREFYRRAGGFADLPLFEDVEFYRRLKKHGRFVHLNSFVTSSSRRFENHSFALVFARWSLFQMLYWLGISPRFLAKYYQAVRK